MKISGKATIRRSAAELWDLLLDPQVLCRCLPGCEGLEPLADGNFGVKLKVRLGILTGRFQGQVRLCDVRPQESYRLVVDARGSTGVVQGETIIRLTELDTGSSTELDYEGQAHVKGLAASVGSRLFQKAALNFAEKFFKALSRL